MKKNMLIPESGHDEARSLSDKKGYKLKTNKINRDLEKELLKVPPLYNSDDDGDTCSLFSENSKKSECKHFNLFIHY